MSEAKKIRVELEPASDGTPRFLEMTVPAGVTLTPIDALQIEESLKRAVRSRGKA